MTHGDRGLAARRRVRVFVATCVVAVGLAAPAASAAIEIESTGWLLTRSGWLHHAVVSGDWVAWSEPYGQSALASIYAHNLATGQTKPVVVASPDLPEFSGGTANIWGWAWWHPQIAISGSTVVFADRRNYKSGNSLQLRTHNLETGVETIVSPTWLSQPGFPAIDGDRIVYQRDSGPAYLGWVGTSTASYIGGSSFPLPDISGDLVVWKTGNSAGSRIEYLDLSSGQRRVIFSANAWQDPRNPMIDGQIVVWSMRDLTEGGDNIVRVMAYDIETGQLITVCEHTGSPEHRSMVSVSGDIVVWEDWRSGNRDIYGYDLSSGQEFAIATGRADQRGPSIDGDLVVWSQGYSSIGWARLTRTPEPAMATMLIAAFPVLMRRGRRGGERRRI